MEKTASKRNVPPIIRKILDIDVKLTEKFVLWANQFVPLRSLRTHYKILEISCHGIAWFACWIAFMWVYTSKSLVQMQINMLLGLIIDIVLIAVIKAYTRRRRPPANKNDSFAEMGPDKFSFPSGHASRAAYVAYFFCNLYPLPIIFWLPVLSWATSVSLSRVLLNRHHVLDVIVGVLLGILEGILLGFLWLDQETALWMWNSLTDEKLQGGEFHV
ncbi:phospholipid phosphatase 6 [Agrilus planipennis]|uniref:Phospholipid phosphatase 6 n=1 Tax=Agrilus planipennis TaxID=224129 RepID=A0A1W4WJT3_AGRPL|nr:phospholipid phosphatase 6 [Agrilus planipennis]